MDDTSAPLLTQKSDGGKGHAGSSSTTVISLPLTQHGYSVEYMRNRLIAAAIRIPIWLLIGVARYVLYNSFALRRRYGVARKHVRIPSRQPGRMIKAEIYTPIHDGRGVRRTGTGPNGQAVGPVHVNWHGSGFVMDCFGADADLCAFLADKMRCTVIDADYRKAPEHPFPAGIQDAEDVCTYVFGRPDRFDTNNVSVGGSSAGANLALVMAVLFGSRIRAVATVAPPTDFRPSSRPKVAPIKHSRALPAWLARWFDQCYLVQSADRDDPRLSPACARLDANQLSCDAVYIATGTGDTLYQDASMLIENLHRQGHRNAILRSVPGEGHGFEKAMVAGPRKDKAIAVINEMAKVISDSWKRSDSDFVRAPL